jgi:hypothetical protein
MRMAARNEPLFCGWASFGRSVPRGMVASERSPAGGSFHAGVAIGGAVSQRAFVTPPLDGRGQVVSLHVRMVLPRSTLWAVLRIDHHTYPQDEDCAEAMVPEHRGRVQAQDGGVEESVAWAQSTPPTVSDGLRFLEQLRSKLTPREQEARAEAFKEAGDYIQSVSRVGGMLHTHQKKSFPKKARRDHRRVDIEVNKGVAFVPEDPS